MSFFKRNSFIFLIGGVIILGILTVIILAQNSETGISLRESLFNVTQREDEELEDVYFPEELSSEETVPKDIYINPSFDIPESRQTAPPPPKYPLIEVEFNGEYFNPRSFEAAKGQIIRWTNTSDSPITIVQLLRAFEEFDGGLVLSPGESYQLELYRDGLWTYKDKATGAKGRVLINPGRSR